MLLPPYQDTFNQFVSTDILVHLLEQDILVFPKLIKHTMVLELFSLALISLTFDLLQYE